VPTVPFTRVAQSGSLVLAVFATGCEVDNPAGAEAGSPIGVDRRAPQPRPRLPAREGGSSPDREPMSPDGSQPPRDGAVVSPLEDARLTPTIGPNDAGGLDARDGPAQHTLDAISFFEDQSGTASTYSTNGAIDLTTENPFFASLGTNGRSCGSC